MTDLFVELWPEMAAIAMAGMALTIAILAYVAPRTKTKIDDRVLEILKKVMEFEKGLSNDKDKGK